MHSWTMRDNRRATLKGLAGALGSQFVPTLVGAAGNPYVLGPQRAANWAQHKTYSNTKVTQLAAGVKFDTPGKLPQADIGDVALWARKRLTGDIRCVFDYTALVKPLVQDGSFSIFYFDIMGVSPEFPAALPDWPNVTPSTDLYFTHTRGLRFSFSNFAQANANYLSLRWFDGTHSHPCARLHLREPRRYGAMRRPLPRASRHNNARSGAQSHPLHITSVATPA